MTGYRGVGVAELARLMRCSATVVALTGAGVSVPSGIPDFRTPGSGLWENEDPMEVAHIGVFRREPKRFWRFYGRRFAMLADKRPNPAHQALAELERRGMVSAVVTQNIDGLHQEAGSREVVEVHGSISSASCPACGSRHPRPEVVARISQDAEGVPRCPRGHALKPDVVLFGELLPSQAVERAWALAGQADLLLCVGSSLEVHPVAQLPRVTLEAGGRLALVTRGPTPYDRDAAVRLDGDVAENLPALVTALAADR